MPDSPLQRLRTQAVAHSLGRPATLRAAIHRLGFVQADPIRSPARAQDLILRHRVKGYRAGDLERLYPTLGIDEDFLYAYGFLTQSVREAIHPRKTRRLRKLESLVHDLVREHDRMHPRELEAHLGRKRVINAWGGYSKATTRALEHLHYRGMLRVVGRENGIRIYQGVTEVHASQPPAERLRQLVLTIVNILSPVPRRTLQSLVARYNRLGNPRSAVDAMLHSGEVEQSTLDGIAYVYPPRPVTANGEDRAVRFLAPFDPIVWDRRRFEHLWGWAYRFEAYTPAAKRVRGYYAMPLLWGTDVIGWANASRNSGGLTVDVGFVNGRPTAHSFPHELDLEIDRLREFLKSEDYFATGSTETARPSV